MIIIIIIILRFLKIIILMQKVWRREFIFVCDERTKWDCWWGSFILIFPIKLSTFCRDQKSLRKNSEKLSRMSTYFIQRDERESERASERKRVKNRRKKVRICYGRYNFILFRVMHLTKSITISSNGAHNSDSFHLSHFLFPKLFVVREVDWIL